MNQTLQIVVAGMAGMALGILYFGSLWWTVQRLATEQRPARLLLSYVARTVVLVAGVVFVSGGSWVRAATCLVGLVLARMIMCSLISRAMRVKYARREIH